MGVDKGRKFTLYVLTFPNDMAYVGITSQKLKDRWSNGKGYKNQPVNEGIEEFGWGNVQKKIIAENLDMKEAKQLEKKYIAEYEKIGEVYNKTGGGECGSLLTAEFEYRGETLSSKEIAELSSVPGLDYHDITTRVNHHGWDLETAMTQEKMRKDIEYEYKGNWYTIKELMQFCKTPGLTYDQVRSRISNGWDIERALTQPNNVKKQPKGIGERKYFYNGKWCNSYDLFLMRKDERIMQSDIVSRIERSGWSIEDAISKPPKNMNNTYLYKGKYCSSKELETLSPVGLQYNTIVSRIKTGWPVDEAVELPAGSKPSRKVKN